MLLQVRHVGAVVEEKIKEGKGAKRSGGREHILQAAIRMLSRQGFAQTSLLDIATEAGMSKGALHYHFPTKEALIADVLQAACDAVAQRTAAVWESASDPSQSLRAALQELWRVRAERSQEVLVVADLLAQSLYDSALRAQLAAYYERGVAQIEEQLARHLKAWGLRLAVPSAMAARLLIGLLDGLVMQVFVKPGSVSQEDVLDAFQILAGALLQIEPEQSAAQAASG